MERITTAEAARRLGVSPTQVRRLVAAGKYTAETEQRPQGKRLIILWPAEEDAPQDATDTQHHAPEVATEDATPRAADVARLVADNARLRDEIGREVNARAELEHRLAAEQETHAWLEERIERAEEAGAELRRMLNLEQQTVARMREQLPAGRNANAPIDATGTPPTQPSQKRPPGAQRRRWWAFWQKDDG